MLLLHGHRTARIKIYSDHSQACKNCRSFDLTIAVYRKYFHVFFLPIFAYGEKSAKVWCSACGESFRSDSLLREYEKKARSPLYLYSGVLLVGLLIAGGIIAHIATKSQDAQFVRQPVAGDVYLIRHDASDGPLYSFLKLKALTNDSVFLIRSRYGYNRFVYKFNDEDYFMKEQTVNISRKQLQEMYDQDEIISVKRNYDAGDGFQREQ